MPETLTLNQIVDIYERCDKDCTKCDTCPLYDRQHIQDDWICNLLFRVEKRADKGWERPLIKVTQ
jgi:hypothetical protein